MHNDLHTYNTRLIIQWWLYTRLIIQWLTSHQCKSLCIILWNFMSISTMFSQVHHYINGRFTDNNIHSIYSFSFTQFKYVAQKQSHTCTIYVLISSWMFVIGLDDGQIYGRNVGISKKKGVFSFFGPHIDTLNTNLWRFVTMVDR